MIPLQHRFVLGDDWVPVESARTRKICCECCHRTGILYNYKHSIIEYCPYCRQSWFHQDNGCHDIEVAMACSACWDRCRHNTVPCSGKIIDILERFKFELQEIPWEDLAYARESDLDALRKFSGDFDIRTPAVIVPASLHPGILLSFVLITEDTLELVQTYVKWSRLSVVFNPAGTELVTCNSLSTGLRNAGKYLRKSSDIRFSIRCVFGRSDPTIYSSADTQLKRAYDRLLRSVFPGKYPF